MGIFFNRDENYQKLKSYVEENGRQVGRKYVLMYNSGNFLTTITVADGEPIYIEEVERNHRMKYEINMKNDRTFVEMWQFNEKTQEVDDYLGKRELSLTEVENLVKLRISIHKGSC